jgi:hypothetical protein
MSQKFISNVGVASRESVVFSDLEELLGDGFDEPAGDPSKLQINSWRKDLLVSNQAKRNAASSMEPFTTHAFEDRVDAVGDTNSEIQINLDSSNPPGMPRGNTCKKVMKYKNPYHIDSFKCLNSAYRMNLWIYVAIQFIIAAYLGNDLAGALGFPGMMWILTIFFLKIAIDLSIVACHFGKHQDKLLAPALISTATFAFPAVLLLIMNEFVRFIQF